MFLVTRLHTRPLLWRYRGHSLTRDNWSSLGSLGSIHPDSRYLMRWVLRSPRLSGWKVHYIFLNTGSRPVAGSWFSSGVCVWSNVASVGISRHFSALAVLHASCTCHRNGRLLLLFRMDADFGGNCIWASFFFYIFRGAWQGEFYPSSGHLRFLGTKYNAWI